MTNKTEMEVRKKLEGLLRVIAGASHKPISRKDGEMKTCQLGLPIQCQYQTVNSGTIPCGCNFMGYCDYQLPRDSRAFNKKE